MPKVHSYLSIEKILKKESGVVLSNLIDIVSAFDERSGSHLTEGRDGQIASLAKSIGVEYATARSWITPKTAHLQSALDTSARMRGIPLTKNNRLKRIEQWLKPTFDSVDRKHSEILSEYIDHLNLIQNCRIMIRDKVDPSTDASTRWLFSQAESRLDKSNKMPIYSPGFRCNPTFRIDRDHIGLLHLPNSPDIGAIGQQLVLLLLMDCVRPGVWGISLANDFLYFGRTLEDIRSGGRAGLASITISGRAVEALALVCRNSTHLIEKKELVRYIYDQQDPVHGVIGSKRSGGALPSSAPQLEASTRHTACAIGYLDSETGDSELIRRSLSYLEGQRRDSAWSDRPTVAQDPLTTASVLRTLQDNRIICKSDWESSVCWLKAALSSQNSRWLLESPDVESALEKRAFENLYTADILQLLPELEKRAPQGMRLTHRRLIEEMYEEWVLHSFGIPTGRNESPPDLQTTFQFATAVLQLDGCYSKLRKDIRSRLVKDLVAILEFGRSTSAGWASALSLLMNEGMMKPLGYRGIDSLRKGSKTLIKSRDINSALARILPNHVLYIAHIARALAKLDRSIDNSQYFQKL